MAAGSVRDDDELGRALESWLAHRFPDRLDGHVDAVRRPKAGWTNETVLADLSWVASGGAPGSPTRHADTIVVRLPPIVPSFPHYALDDQAAVLRALAGGPIPVPDVVAVEDDAAWLGAPFIVMSCVSGRPVGEVPGLDRWLLASSVERQREIHETFLGTLAALHRVEWRSTGLDATLRIGVAHEIAYWIDYVGWYSAGDPPRRLADALDWCRQTMPDSHTGGDTGGEAALALLWGDARLGNVMYDDDGAITALLDWELATIGPPELDLAWYLALDALTTHFVQRTVPGFLDRAGAIECYEAALGRRVAHLEWHEVFALVRSIAVNDCQARLAAKAGTRYPGVAGDDNPALDYVWSRISDCA